MYKINIDKILPWYYAIFPTLIGILIWLFFINNLNSETTTQLINRYSHKWEVDKRIMFSIMEQESQGRKTAVSHKGAIGTMQVMPITGRSYWRWRYKKEKKKWMIPYTIAPDIFYRQYLKVEPVNVCISGWYMKQCLIKTKGNYIKAINKYMNGNKKRVSWTYINDIIDRIINFQ